MRVSIIVPFKNEEKYIRSCIESLLNQKFNGSYEMIFVDNGSTDKSYEFAQKYNDIRVIKVATGNEYTARNKALKIANGSVIAFTDADCIVSKVWLHNIVYPITQGADIVLGKRIFPTNSSYILKIFEKYENFKARKVINEKLKHKYFGYANNMAIASYVLKSTKGFRAKPVNGDTQIIYDYSVKNGSIDIRFAENATVIHQEIVSEQVWLNKLISYGKQNALYEISNINYKPLSFSERLSFITDSSLSNIDKIASIPILMSGSLAYSWGELILKCQNILKKSA